MRRLPAFIALALAALVPPAVVACGGDETSTTSDPNPSPPLTPTATGKTPDPGPTPTTTTTPTQEPPPEPEWVPPVVPTTSPGCGTARTQPVGTEYLTPAGRNFHVWGPPSYDKDKTYPVVVMYHGLGMNEPGVNGPLFQDWFKMENQVDGEAFVVYASATGSAWDAGNPAELTYFDQLVKKLGEEYCINPSRVLAFGFSWGGTMASVLACKRAGYVKALAIGAGSWGGGIPACGRLPVQITNRTEDDNETVAMGSNTAKRWAAYNKCGATPAMSDPAMNCVSYGGCKLPGSVTFCEDTHSDDSWPAAWNHTIRENYRHHMWTWFKALP